MGLLLGRGCLEEAAAAAVTLRNEEWKRLGPTWQMCERNREHIDQLNMQIPQRGKTEMNKLTETSNCTLMTRRSARPSSLVWSKRSFTRVRSPGAERLGRGRREASGALDPVPPRGGGGDSPQAASPREPGREFRFPATIAHHSPLLPTFSGRCCIASFLSLPEESLIVSGQTLLAASRPRVNPVNPGTPA